MYDFSYFKLVETCVMAQNSLCLVNALSPVGKNVYSVFVEWTFINIIWVKFFKLYPQTDEIWHHVMY